MNIIEQVISRITELNPMHGKKLKKSLPLNDPQYLEQANSFLEKYKVFAAGKNKDLEYGIECYLRMCADVLHETIAFMETGKYTSTSFAEVNQRVYNNPEVMDYYMHALIMSEFLWAHHYKMYRFFLETLPLYKGKVKSYLEIGAGHGLFVAEALKIFDKDVKFDVVDISPVSLEMTKQFVNNPKVNYKLTDVFDFHPEKGYDFVTMGEVLEHVEDPVALLKKVASLLADGGTAFITTPTNAPAIDHIFLFRNYEHILEIIDQAGLKPVHEFKCYAENVPDEVAEELKITLIYAGFLQKK